MPPPETVVFDIDEQIKRGVHRQPGERSADTERVDVQLREHGRACAIVQPTVRVDLLCRLLTSDKSAVPLDPGCRPRDGVLPDLSR